MTNSSQVGRWSTSGRGRGQLCQHASSTVPCRPRGRAHQRRVGVHAADDTRGRSVTAPSDGERLDARGTRIRCICPRYTVVRPADDDRNRCGNISGQSASLSSTRPTSIVRREVGIRFLEDPVTLKGPLRSFVFPKPFARKLERASQAQNADLRPGQDRLGGG